MAVNSFNGKNLAYVAALYSIWRSCSGQDIWIYWDSVRKIMLFYYTIFVHAVLTMLHCAFILKFTTTILYGNVPSACLMAVKESLNILFMN
jgi:hypothetical protein